MKTQANKSPQPKTRSRLAILNWICQFSLAREFSDGTVWALQGSRFREDRRPKPGSLVALQSAPHTKWYLSWVHEVIPGTCGFDDVYVLESIEDGELGNWSNVSIIAYDETKVGDFPEWRWTDKQHEFYDRWQRVCYKDCDAYITLPIKPKFHEDGSVTLGTRTRFGFDDHRPTKTFPNWKKVTKARMKAFYEEAHDSRPKKAAA